MDLHRDKYLLLGSDLTRSAFENQKQEPSDPDLQRTSPVHSNRTSLIGHNLKGVPANLIQAATIPMPTSTRWPTNRYGLGLGHSVPLTVSALRSLADVQRSLRRRSVQQTIEYLRGLKRRSRSKLVRPDVQHLLDSYFAARPWFPAKPICRLDAPALCLHIWRNGGHANFVFGVRLEPFAAHCWAQSDGSSLNEPHDNLEQYTQIMIV